MPAKNAEEINYLQIALAVAHWKEVSHRVPACECHILYPTKKNETKDKLTHENCKLFLYLLYYWMLRKKPPDGSRNVVISARERR